MNFQWKLLEQEMNYLKFVNVTKERATDFLYGYPLKIQLQPKLTLEETMEMQKEK